VSIDADAQLVLASASPRRLLLLEQIGLRVRALPAEIDETPGEGETPEALVRRLAADKARAVADRLRAEQGAHPPVLGSDTEVVLEGRVFGKPAGRSDALAMLARLSGRVHEVLTAVAVVTAAGVQVALSRSRVEFREIAREEAEAYWATGEPRDKAGAYAIQGMGAIFAVRLDGSYSGVMGLPLAETELLLRGVGIDVWRQRGESR
jgi:septum formation protein